jgi:hypothetical protein
MRNLMISLLFLLAPLTLAAGDLSGTWAGPMELKTPDGQTQTMPVTAEFKQNGKAVTGTTGREGDEQLTVQNGVIDGDKFKFEVQAPDATYAVSLTITSNDQLDGSVSFTDPGGNKQTAKLTLTRQK